MRKPTLRKIVQGIMWVGERFVSHDESAAFGTGVIALLLSPLYPGRGLHLSLALAGMLTTLVFVHGIMSYELGSDLPLFRHLHRPSFFRY